MITNISPAMSCLKVIDILLERANKVTLNHLLHLRRERAVFEKNSSTLQHAIYDNISSQDIDIDKLKLGQIETDAVYIYCNYLSKDKSVRGAILSLNNQRCVYCMICDASQLDHFYPKDVFPSLALDPWNLVPCCDQCNSHKGAYYGPNAINKFSFIHPYSCEVVPAFLSLNVGLDCADAKDPIIICRFYYNSFGEISDAKREQIMNQLNKLDLFSRWQDYVERRTYQDLLNSIRSNMADPFFDKESVRDAIKSHIEYSLRRFYRDKDIVEYNNPEYVFYDNMLTDDKNLDTIINSLYCDFVE